MARAVGSHGSWFVNIPDLNLYLPRVHHWYVVPPRYYQWHELPDKYTYDDAHIGADPDRQQQRPAYIRAIKRKQVVLAISFPINRDNPSDGFTPLGYDAVWSIDIEKDADVIRTLIHFRFQTKLYDLYPRVDGYPPSPHPTYERSRWPGSSSR